MNVWTVVGVKTRSFNQFTRKQTLCQASKTGILKKVLTLSRESPKYLFAGENHLFLTTQGAKQKNAN